MVPALEGAHDEHPQQVQRLHDHPAQVDRVAVGEQQKRAHVDHLVEAVDEHEVLGAAVQEVARDDVFGALENELQLENVHFALAPPENAPQVGSEQVFFAQDVLALFLLVLELVEFGVVLHVDVGVVFDVRAQLVQLFAREQRVRLAPAPGLRVLRECRVQIGVFGFLGSERARLVRELAGESEVVGALEGLHLLFDELLLVFEVLRQRNEHLLVRLEEVRLRPARPRLVLGGLLFRVLGRLGAGAEDRLVAEQHLLGHEVVLAALEVSETAADGHDSLHVFDDL